MNMLTKYQIELIHREIDGENTPEASAEVRELVAAQPEALTLMTSLQSLDALFREIPSREPPPGLRHAIYTATSANPEAGYAQGRMQLVTRWAAQQWNGVSTFMEELMSTKKVLLVATTAVAVIAIIGHSLVGYPPSVFDAGTIGSGSDMGGVQQAARYHGAKKTEADVTLSSPEITALLQNDQVLKLVKSDAFREAMHNDAFRMVMSSEAFRALMTSDAFRALMSSESFRMLMSSESFRMLMSNESFRMLMSSESFRMLLANDAFRELMANAQYRELMANAQYRELMSNAAYRELMSSAAFRELAHSQSLSEAFLNEAMRVQ